MRPSWHISIPAAAIRSTTLSANAKLLLAGYDDQGRGARCSRRLETVAEGVGLSLRSARRANQELQAKEWTRRVQVGPRNWETELLGRRNPAWGPGWIFRYWNLPQCSHLPVQAKVSYLAMIAGTPQRKLLRDGTKAPWCELPADTLAAWSRSSRNAVPEIIQMTTEVGLALAVHRPGRPTVVLPTVEPEGYDLRAHRADCILNILSDRGELTSGYEVIGLDAPFITDDPMFAEDLLNRPIARLTATGYTKRVIAEKYAARGA